MTSTPTKVCFALSVQLRQLTDNHIGVDKATDKAGLGDKYDDKIDQYGDKALNEQMQKQGKSDL